MPNKEAKDQQWMQKALQESKKAAENGELPIAAIVVAGDTELIRSQTQTGRRKSMTGHAELWALIELQRRVYSKDRPVTIYTTLEPCLMCLGAAMQCGVDEIVFAMEAAPDGGTRYVNSIIEGGQKAPEIRKGICESEARSIMETFIAENPRHPGIGYARSLVK